MHIGLFLILLFVPGDSAITVRHDVDYCDSVASCLRMNWDSLEPGCLKSFLSAFSDERCKNNAEWSEGANEHLFRLIDRKPSLFFSTLFAMSPKQIAAVKREVDHPVNDGIPIIRIYDRVKQAQLSHKLKKRALDLLSIAYANEKEEIQNFEKKNGKKWEYPPWE